ncbi:MAG TPA: ABC transporter permease [Microbacteriaceae bacterium]|nr:ABC transporter permease [Microbacteriaceae bacterium]
MTVTTSTRPTEVDEEFETAPEELAPRPARPASRGRRATPAFFRSRAWGWVVVLALLAAWQISAWVKYVPTVSSPERVGIEWWEAITQGGLLLALLDTLRTMAIGFAIAVPVGIAIGFLMGRVRVVWATLEPLVEILRLTPATAVIPVFILFLGIGDAMKIGVFLLAAIFPVLLNAYAGARSVSQTQRETAQTFRLGWWETQWEVALPAAIPFILVGARQALGLSLVMAVVIGMLAGNGGIGYYILMAQQALDIPRLFAAVATVAAVGYGFNALFLVLERRYTRWRRTDAHT